MFNFMNNLNIKKKIVFGFGLILILLLISGIVAINSLSNANDNFQHYRQIAINTNNTGRVQANTLEARIAIKNFLQEKDPKYVTAYKENYKLIQKLIDGALDQSASEESDKILKEVKTDMKLYNQKVEEIVKVITELGVVDTKMAEIGKDLINNKLEPLMKAGSVSASRATKHMLLARLYNEKFAQSHKVADKERVLLEFNLADKYLVNLPSAIRNRKKEYKSNFEKSVVLIDKIDQLVDNGIDKIGPEVANNTEELKLAYKKQQDILGPALVSSNTNAKITTLIVIIISLAFGIFFAIMLSNKITKPILKAYNMMLDLGKGKLGTRLNLTEKDEIGQMGNAMDKLADALSDISVGMEKIANGDINYQPVMLSEEDEIAPSLIKIVDSLKRLVDITLNIVNAANNGDLKYRGASDKLMGSYKKIIIGFNTVLNEIENVFSDSGSVLSQLSQGDLTVAMQGNYKGDFNKLKENINNLTSSLNEIIGNVTDAIEATASASSQISSSTEEMAAGAQEQSSQSSEIAAAVQEMTANIIQSSSNANNAVEAAKEAGTIAEEGNAVVMETVRGMENIASVVMEASQTVEELGKSSDQIGEIIQVIDDIADQTNLLALNAAIEAARAGEQGRGFAVVADEVRKLAERTTKATKEIATMIKTIQDKTYGAVESMNNGNIEVEKGKELALKSGESLKLILDGFNRVVSEVNMVAVAAEEQTTAAEDISRNIESINIVSQETAKGVEQIAVAAEDLNQLTENLHRLAGQFKIDTSKIASVNKMLTR